MFDNLREDTSSGFNEQPEAKYQPAAGYRSSKPKRFLGMTSLQRFVIVALLMFTTCILGTMVLLVFGKISL
ncbi:MAG: hypothetical protein LC108_02750 [Anaerolineales bacterium]|nr:hypothetical protein [Anaerolineales bacterium]